VKGRTTRLIHISGTSLGDLIEIQGINEVFEASHPPERPLIVGAVKSCLGHAELVAGLVGVLKTVGSFTYGSMPGLAHLTADNMNPSLDCKVVPLHIPHEPVALKSQGETLPVRALILYAFLFLLCVFFFIKFPIFDSSNGFAGSIAGAILEAPTDDMQPCSSVIPESTPMLFVVSAKTQDTLIQYMNNYLDFCLNSPASLFHAICYTTCVGREHYRYRFACVAHNMQDLISRIEDRLQNMSADASPGNARRILFAFPGQGSQYQGMGRYLASQYTGFRKIITDAAKKATALTGYPILSFLVEESVPGKLTVDDSEIAPVCIFIFQYAVASWLGSLGIQAYAVMGHSLGEIAGAGMWNSPFYCNLAL